MSLYDDLDTDVSKQAPEWSSGINKLIPQPQLQLKNKIQAVQKKPAMLFTPSVNLKPKSIDDAKQKELLKSRIIVQQTPIVPVLSKPQAANEWEEFLAIEDEYNPAIPNEYEKIIQERRDRSKRDERKRQRSQSPPQFGRQKSNSNSGFANRRQSSDEEDNYRPSMGSGNRGGQMSRGTEIAPPKSLQENITIVDTKIANINSYGASAVAAKIMAKYGFKDGQGLGKQEQGISSALQVEKTSKRGGRIINECDFSAVAPPSMQMDSPPQQQPSGTTSASSEETITEMMKNPSKVIVLRNMVGPGEVDDELEPEVKEECRSKYGEVITVHITEMPNVIPEETVRIFVEFTRIESAIKALVDLNGRFFGGRQVRCAFYSAEKYENFIFDA